MVRKSGERVLFYLLILGLVVSLVGMGSLVLKNYREHLHFKDRESRMIEQQARLEEKIAAQSEYLERLLNDEIFLEQVVRQRLGYVDPNEVVFRFETPAREGNR